jgi:hypothetical protein
VKLFNRSGPIFRGERVEGGFGVRIERYFGSYPFSCRVEILGEGAKECVPGTSMGFDLHFNQIEADFNPNKLIDLISNTVGL